MDLKDDLSIKYLVRPSNLTSKKPKTIVMLHGYGSQERDLLSFAPELDPRYLVISARAPYPMTPFGFAWYAIEYDAVNGKFTNSEQAIESRDLIRQFVENIKQKYAVEDVTLMGFSQGAILSYAVALSFPEMVKRIVAMSGYIDKDLLISGYDDSDFSGLSFYRSHGSIDEVVPVDWDRRSTTLLEQLKIKNKYSEFPVGHGVSPENFEEIKDFLKY